MDSLYEAPRRPPTPFCKDMLVGTPVVPEISVLCPSKGPKNVFTSYNQWRQNQLSEPRLPADKENLPSYTSISQNNSILKKQVRFESPVLLMKQPENVQLPMGKKENFTYGAPVGAVPSFEHMYMANIPNRQLDLSIIDLPKRISRIKEVPPEPPRPQERPEQTPKSYKEFLKVQNKANDVALNDSVTDIFNYKRSALDDVAQSPRSKQLVHTHLPSVNNHYEPLKQFQNVTQAISQRTMKKPVEDFQELPSKDTEQKLNKKNDPIQTTRGDAPQTYKLSSFNRNRFASMLENNVETRLNFQNDAQIKTAEMDHCTKNDNLIPPGYNSQSNLTEKTSLKTGTCGCCAEACNSPAVSEQSAVKLRTEDDLSSKDLLRIIAQQSQQIAQQNNQLLLLQQQVSELVSMQKSQADKKAAHCCHVNSHNSDCAETVHGRCISSTQHNRNEGESHFFSKINQEKNQLSNFSIGLTTSFEVSVRRPPLRNSNHFLPRNTAVLDYEYASPKIEEVTETESTETAGHSRQGKDARDTLVDASMVFKDPIQVRESCPSPEPSIKINMNDFDESDSDYDDEEGPQIEASFYKNLMAQVNKVLQKAQIESSHELANMPSPNLNHKTIHKVKETTLKHLRRIGVNLENDESSTDNSVFGQGDNKSYNQEDVSFVVKQLLMKYLPADHLAKLAAKEAQYAQKDATKIGAIKSRPEFSFASLQYMKKYNLIAGGNKESRQKQAVSQSPKILDISKLKQQPKLL